jgi:hypothetical protein
MAANINRRWPAAVFLAALALPAYAESVACHLTYGGETRIISAAPTTDPYSVAPVAIGSYFLFRIVFRREPADLAGIKLYTYADRDAGPTIIHQATHPYPLPAIPQGHLSPRPLSLRDTVNDFTGLNFVYEPVRDGELQYWCELKDAP